MGQNDGPERGSDLNGVTRAGEILFAFTRERPEMGLTRLASEVGLSKATVHRVAQTLVSLGLLEQSEQTRAYRLGVRIMRLADVVASSLDIRKEARSALRHLREQTGETVYLMLLRDNAAACAERIEGWHPMRDLSTPPGTVVPLHVGASGSAILGVLDADALDAAVSGLDPEREAAVRRRVAFAREHGYAVARGDVSQGVGAIAVALRDESGAPVGAVSLGGLLERVEAAETQLAASVSATAAAVTSAMGWS
ncbi:IclR family transcriptional regulator [Microbacterium sp. SLBN-146]|uniref:IclR family transcriptional regulator n=1 Tax=Microbacterium sp. SLBN-146 TaxID=2768457 RepID=UPI0011540073|nr:IclR family transcriptional regulator [Microbacterium sp. SLBN-146]TQJ30914.1 IclR family transcriptional regulator [Microbacterium sp. SLBN-146]